MDMPVKDAWMNWFLHNFANAHSEKSTATIYTLFRTRVDIRRRTRLSPHSVLVRIGFPWLASIRTVLETVKWDPSFKGLSPRFGFVTGGMAVRPLL